MAKNLQDIQSEAPDSVEYDALKAAFKAELRREIGRKLRIPFERILADYLGEFPSAKAVKALAEKSPDRWIQGAVMLAQLAGYSKDLNINVNATINVSNMSDSQIEARKAELLEARKAVMANAKLLAPNVGKMSAPAHAPIISPQVNPDDIQDVHYQDNPSSDFKASDS